MKLTLIRHGLTEGNIRRLYYGAMDLPLLPDGIEALHALRDGGGYPEAERYFTSDPHGADVCRPVRQPAARHAPRHAGDALRRIRRKDLRGPEGRPGLPCVVQRRL